MPYEVWMIMNSCTAKFITVRDRIKQKCIQDDFIQHQGQLSLPSPYLRDAVEPYFRLGRLDTLTSWNILGLAWFPINSSSLKPLLITSAILAPFLSSSAFVATVVPILIDSMSEEFTFPSLSRVLPVSWKLNCDLPFNGDYETMLVCRCHMNPVCDYVRLISQEIYGI